MEKYIVEANDISLKYRHNKKALEHFNLKINENQMIGLIGANGSGKTTFFKLCDGLLSNNEGDLKVLGGSVVKDLEVRKEVIYSFNKLPVAQNQKLEQILKMYDYMYDKFDLDFAKKSLEIFEIPLDSKVKNLSTGIESVFHFICAIATRVKLTMLDEPFNGIDIEKRKMAYEVLLRDYMEHPRTIIVSNHNLGEMEHLLSEMVLIDRGHVVFYKEMDEVREMLFRVDGTEEQLKQLVGKGKILREKQGAISSFIIGEGSVNSDFAREAIKLGLSVSPVEPEDVCVYLTGSNKADQLDSLWD